MSTIKSSDEHLTLNADGAAKEIKLQANGVEKAKVTSTGIDVTGRITTDGITEDTSGNVGIGTSSPSTSLDIQAPSTVGGFRMRGRSGANDEMQMQFYNNANTTMLADIYLNSTNYLSIGTSGSTTLPVRFKTAGSERMRIDSSGNVGIGKTSTADSDDGWYFMPGGRSFSCTSTTDYLLEIQKQNYARIGGIYTNMSTNTTSYITSSDYRLKENIVPLEGAIDRVKELSPKRFTWKTDPDTTVDGFLAHEAQTIVPEAVTGTKDAMRTEEYEVTPAVEATYDEDGNELTPAVEAVMGEREVPDYQGIDQAKLVPLLTSALQEAVAKIEALETRIEALENA